MSFFRVDVLMALVLGSAYGMVLGAIPGLTVTLALALFIPVGLFMEPRLLLPALVGITAMGIFASDVGNIAVKVPGTPASAAYNEEIYEISREQSVAYAMGIASLPSAVGSLIGVTFLIGGTLWLARVAKQFSSFEVFWLVLLGVSSGVLAASPFWKSVLAFGVGMLLAGVGTDPALGSPRFTFGSELLLGGFDFIVALVGLFGVGEVLSEVWKGPVAGEAPVGRRESAGVAREYFVRTWRLMWEKRGLVLRSSLVGLFVGFLPGAGSDFAAWVCSNIERLRGRGKEEVALAGTTANNASIAGDWVPALSLGIPGDTLTAIILGMFISLGITPGPALFEEHWDWVVNLYGAFLVASVVLMPLGGYIAAHALSWVVKVPRRMLMAGVLGVCGVAVYAVNNNPEDLYVAAGFGVLGWLLKAGGFPVGQVVLGLVLGPLLERAFVVSMIKTQWDLLSFFRRPVAVGLAVANVVLVVAVAWYRWRQGRATEKRGEGGAVVGEGG
jgi:putative tricarboxylic transport membrane protein